MMRILAIEPYYGGSHQAFIDGWIEHSVHQWTLLSLPAYKWKWRMRHSAITLAAQASQLVKMGYQWDLIWVSDMLPLAEFRSLVDAKAGALPSILYFHENQFTYPNQEEQARDHHFAFTNYVSCLAADQIWFNSIFHRDNFLSSIQKFLNRMPDYQEQENVSKIESKSRVQYPGIRIEPQPTAQHNRPRRILWSARWEHDKNPELFFQALRQIKSDGIEFQLNILGRHSKIVPTVFEDAIREFDREILFCGFAESREDYESVVRSSDFIISTANHEFFGISVVEALSAGVIPLLPRRLSYPELLSPLPSHIFSQCTYDGSLDDLTAKMAQLIQLRTIDDFRAELAKIANRFGWPKRAAQMDLAVRELVQF